VPLAPPREHAITIVGSGDVGFLAAVNVFARLYGADTFFAICRRMRLEGAKRLEIARASLQPAATGGLER
jgi:hypothetical protein